MGYTKITALSLTDLFVQQIENMILSGELAVGDQLPAARELSVRMGVSRPVISAGLTQLEKMGFVEVRPRQGVFISDYRRRGTVETLVAIMRYNSGAMRKNEVKSLLETRQALECLCVHLVIENASDEELETLAGVLDTLDRCTDCEEAAELVFRFHHELAVFSGNVLLPLMYYSFKPQSIYLWSLYCRNNSVRDLYDIKLRLYRSILNRDEEDSVRQTREIMAAALDDLAVYGI